MENTPPQNIIMIPIKNIHILNPRVRNNKVFLKIVDNIAAVGLKRPITVTKSFGTHEDTYDLVCGQGRLEAFMALGQSTIPAIVIEANEEEAYLKSLIENLERRQHSSLDLLKGVEALFSKGYTAKEIAVKTGLTTEYVTEIVKLIERGEERLIAAVEKGKVALNIAVKIAMSPGEEQNALQEAYENNNLRGTQLLQAQKLIEMRRRRGKTVRSRSPSLRSNRNAPLSGQDVIRIYQKEVDRKRSLTQKAEFVATKVLFVTEALRSLYKQDHFCALLKAENLTTLPKPLADTLQKEKRSW